MKFHAIFKYINKIFDDQQPCRLPGLIFISFIDCSVCSFINMYVLQIKNCSFIDHNMSLKRGMKHGSINKCGWMNFTLWMKMTKIH